MMLIDCLVQHLQERADQRGYTWSEVAPCIASRAGDAISVDIDHPAYPRKPKITPCLAGTELKKLLGTIGITATDTCPCNSRAAYMDEMGCQWVLDNLETVVDWLEEEAGARSLPFIRSGGKMLVLTAVRLARHAQTKAAPT